MWIHWEIEPFQRQRCVARFDKPCVGVCCPTVLRNTDNKNRRLPDSAVLPQSVGVLQCCPPYKGATHTHATRHNIKHTRTGKTADCIHPASLPLADHENDTKGRIGSQKPTVLGLKLGFKEAILPSKPCKVAPPKGTRGSGPMTGTHEGYRTTSRILAAAREKAPVTQRPVDIHSAAERAKQGERRGRPEKIENNRHDGPISISESDGQEGCAE